MLQAHMARTEGQESARKQEQADQERRFKTLQHQFGLLQIEDQARTSPYPQLPDVGWERPDMDPPGSDGHSVVSSQVQISTSLFLLKGLLLLVGGLKLIGFGI